MLINRIFILGNNVIALIDISAPAPTYSVCVFDHAPRKPQSFVSLLWIEPLWVVNLIYSPPQLEMSLPSATDHSGCPVYIIKTRAQFLIPPIWLISPLSLSLCLWWIHTQQDTVALRFQSHCFIPLFFSCTVYEPFCFRSLLFSFPLAFSS